VRHGLAVAAVTGGALALTGGAVAGLPAPAAVPAPAGVAAFTAPLPGAPAVAVPAPVATPAAPPVLDPATLTRAVQRAQDEAQRLAREARETRETPPSAAPAPAPGADTSVLRGDPPAARATPEAGPAACDLDTGELGRVKPHVRAAALALGCAFGEPEVLGVAGRGGPSEHPKGLALDFVVDRATGDRLAACVQDNRAALGVSYVIWRQRIDTGSGFRPMPDRGGATANHFDHVHVSFRPGAGSGDPIGC
jgi:hypothetical protein